MCLIPTVGWREMNNVCFLCRPVRLNVCVWFRICDDGNRSFTYSQQCVLARVTLDLAVYRVDYSDLVSATGI